MLEETKMIRLRKKMNRWLSDARNNAKPGKCILCGKPQTSFCNSHSVPRFVLKNIAENGKVLQSTLVMGGQIMDIEKGVANSGTFFYICMDCDGKFFQDYEDEKSLESEPTGKMLAEIALKNFLLQINKKEIERFAFREVEDDIIANRWVIEKVCDLDIRDYMEEVQLHKSIVEKDISGEYQILYWRVLPYKVPIAMQGTFALQKDLDGREVNDNFDYSKSVRMQHMHLAVFPLKEKSVVLAFYHKRDKGYRNLRHQINSMSEQDVLKFVNYLIFAYDENYFFSGLIRAELETNENLSKLGQEMLGYPNLGFMGSSNDFGIGYEPIGMDEIPNFLAPEWALAN